MVTVRHWRWSYLAERLADVSTAQQQTHIKHSGDLNRFTFCVIKGEMV
jgi:hypothetical protein